VFVSGRTSSGEAKESVAGLVVRSWARQGVSSVFSHHIARQGEAATNNTTPHARTRIHTRPQCNCQHSEKAGAAAIILGGCRCACVSARGLVRPAEMSAQPQPLLQACHQSVRMQDLRRASGPRNEHRQQQHAQPEATERKEGFATRRGSLSAVPPRAPRTTRRSRMHA
jgi:hypothetical protein